MAQFSRKTVLAATDYLNFEMTHANLTRFLLEYGLEGIADSGSVESRANSIARYLLEDPNRTTDDGLNLTDAVVEDVVRRAISKCTSRDYGFDYERFKERYPYLVRTLEVNGFTVEDGQFRRALPESLDLPAVADELQLLLERRALRTSQGHLNQAIDAHARGHWASANAQVRAFFESLFDEIATLVDPTKVQPRELARLGDSFWLTFRIRS